MPFPFLISALLFPILISANFNTKYAYEVDCLNMEFNADCFKTLTARDLKIRYNELARKFHPDKNSNGRQRFMVVKDSYNILLDALNENQGKPLPENDWYSFAKQMSSKEELEEMVKGLGEKEASRHILKVFEDALKSGSSDIVQDLTLIVSDPMPLFKLVVAGTGIKSNIYQDFFGALLQNQDLKYFLSRDKIAHFMQEKAQENPVNEHLVETLVWFFLKYDSIDGEVIYDALKTTPALQSYIVKEFDDNYAYAVWNICFEKDDLEIFKLIESAVPFVYGKPILSLANREYTMEEYCVIQNAANIAKYLFDRNSTVLKTFDETILEFAEEKGSAKIYRVLLGYAELELPSSRKVSVTKNYGYGRKSTYTESFGYFKYVTVILSKEHLKAYVETRKLETFEINNAISSFTYVSGCTESWAKREYLREYLRESSKPGATKYEKSNSWNPSSGASSLLPDLKFLVLTVPLVLPLFLQG